MQNEAQDRRPGAGGEVAEGGMVMEKPMRTEVRCAHMTPYGECTLTEDPCVQGPCSLEEPEEWVAVVRCAACRHRTEPKCNKADYAARGFVKCGCTKSPCYGRLVYLTDFCSYGERKPE